MKIRNMIVSVCLAAVSQTQADDAAVPPESWKVAFRGQQQLVWDKLHKDDGKMTVPTGHRIPAKGETLGIWVHRSPRSEGTLHIPGWWTRARTAPMRRSFRTRRFRHFGPRVAPWAGMQGPVGAMWNSGLGQTGVDVAFAVMVAVILRNRVAVREFLGPLFPG